SAGPPDGADLPYWWNTGDHPVLCAGLDERPAVGQDRRGILRDAAIARALPGFRAAGSDGGPALPERPVLPGVERTQGFLRSQQASLGLRVLHRAVQPRLRRGEAGEARR